MSNKNYSDLLKDRGLDDNSYILTVTEDQILDRGSFRAGDITIAITPEDIQSMDLMDEDSAQEWVNEKADEARRDAEDTTIDNLWRYGARDAMLDLLKAAENGNLENAVSPTDLLLHGPVVAAVREAIQIMEDYISELHGSTTKKEAA